MCTCVAHAVTILAYMCSHTLSLVTSHERNQEVLDPSATDCHTIVASVCSPSSCRVVSHNWVWPVMRETRPCMSSRAL
jgi:hypothetical protein